MNEQFSYLWRNGSVVPWETANVHVSKIGHACVSSVFEGIRAYWNDEQKQLHVFRSEDHLRRFEASMDLAGWQKEFGDSDLR